MKLEKITGLWLKIQQIDPKLISEFGQPLNHLEAASAYFELPPLPLPEFNYHLTEIIDQAKPSFRDLTGDILNTLLWNLHNQTDISTVALWAEKLLRFCEIRLPTLKKRAFNKWVSRQKVNELMLRLTSFLLDFYFFSLDLRYLNTVLKLSDLKWITDHARIQSKLSFTDQRLEFALLEYRILLLNTYALQTLVVGAVQ
jgi:hypothetical protein